MTRFASKNWLGAAWRLGVACLAALLLAGCLETRTNIQQIEEGDWSARQIFNYAEDVLNGDVTAPARGQRNGVNLIGRYAWAAYLFDYIELIHPHDPLAQEGQIRSGMAHFAGENYDQAIEKLQEFKREHPGYARLDIADYLIAMSNYSQISLEGFDPGENIAAVAAFTRFLEQYPDSPLTTDARLRLTAAQTQLASSEMRIGRTLQRSNNFQGAISRYRVVIDDYDTTPFIEEALYRTVESNLSMGLRGEAEDWARILGHNYPQSEWYAAAFQLLTGRKIELPKSADEEPGFWEGLFNFQSPF